MSKGNRKPLTALVLSGGGARGAYEAGIITTLVERYGECFDVVCGTSIGAINGALLAQGDLASLKTLWKTISRRNVIEPVPRIKPLTDVYAALETQKTQFGFAHILGEISLFETILIALWRLRPLESLSRVAGLMSSATIADLLAQYLDLARLECVFIAAATNLTSASTNTFYHYPQAYRDYLEEFLANVPGAVALSIDTYVNAIRASAAIPGIFAPVSMDLGLMQNILVDGGVTNNTPIGQAIDAGATEITVVYVEDPASAGPALSAEPTLFEIAVSCFSTMQQRLLTLDFETALQTNDAARAGGAEAEGKRQVTLRRFFPTKPLTVGIIDFKDQRGVDAAFQQGQADASNDSLRLNFRV